ncbi:MAG: hypothetical protein RL329_3938 [Bacteroidota bacterium]
MSRQVIDYHINYLFCLIPTGYLKTRKEINNNFFAKKIIIYLWSPRRRRAVRAPEVNEFFFAKKNSFISLRILKYRIVYVSF